MRLFAKATQRGDGTHICHGSSEAVTKTVVTRDKMTRLDHLIQGRRSVASRKGSWTTSIAGGNHSC